ncbi:MAG: PHP domain-containing protein [Peptococcaceae bacterium]|nr:PHP domain-containing protein [Peptococcaceae bacterium]
MAWYADLHCHTCCSDGWLSATEVVHRAVEKGIRVLAITDHDSIEGWPEAWAAAKEGPLKMIPGVEINTSWYGKEVHVLGYFDPGFITGQAPQGEKGLSREEGHERGLEELERGLEVLRAQRRDRCQAVVAKLNTLGVEIAWEEVESVAKGPSVGRAHIARVLVQRQVVSSMQEAFVRYLNEGAAAYVVRDDIRPLGAIKMIKESGGVAVLAHPKGMSLHVLTEWVKEGLEGLEVRHPDLKPSQTKALQKWARHFDILATGGSDFHGQGIRAEMGEFGIEEEGLSALVQRLRNISGHEG